MNEHEAEQKWLAALKVGDTVAVTGGWHLRFVKIAKETPKYWLVDGERYKKSNGYRVQPRGSYHFSRITKVTQDMLDDAMQRKLAGDLSGVSWRNKPAQLLKAVATLLEYEAQHVTAITIRAKSGNTDSTHDLRGWDGTKET